MLQLRYGVNEIKGTLTLSHYHGNFILVTALKSSGGEMRVKSNVVVDGCHGDA